MTKEIVLNSQQDEALSSMKAWLEDQTPEHTFFVLSGFAGTGKTTITRMLLEDLPPRYRSVIVSAPTNKAKKVIESVTGYDGQTLHKLLGIAPNIDLKDFDPNYPVFDQKNKATIGDYDLVIIDESSMINRNLWDYINTISERSNTRILFMGDSGQLPPVGEEISQVFVSEDIGHKMHLSKVERQADGNPLMSVYDAIRSNLASSKDMYHSCTQVTEKGEGAYFLKEVEEFKKMIENVFTSSEIITDADYAKLMAWTNSAVTSWNTFIRSVRFPGETRLFEQGDILMSYGGTKQGLVNSQDYIVWDEPKLVQRSGVRKWELTLSSVGDGRIALAYVVDPEPENIKEATYFLDRALKMAKESKPGRNRGMMWRQYYELKDEFQFNQNIFRRDGRTLAYKKDIDYGYAITVHKSQGSTYNTVFIDMDDIDRNEKDMERNNLKYVALSRPSKLAVVLSSKSKSDSPQMSLF